MSIPFLLDKKPTVVPVDSAGEQSGGARSVPQGAARLNSEQAAPSACVSRRFSAPQIVWNRSTRRAGARGGAPVGRPRWLRILMITGGSSIPEYHNGEHVYVTPISTACWNEDHRPLIPLTRIDHRLSRPVRERK